MVVHQNPFEIPIDRGLALRNVADGGGLLGCPLDDRAIIILGFAQVEARHARGSPGDELPHGHAEIDLFHGLAGIFFQKEQKRLFVSVNDNAVFLCRLRDKTVYAGSFVGGISATSDLSWNASIHRHD